MKGKSKNKKEILQLRGKGSREIETNEVRSDFILKLELLAHEIKTLHNPNSKFSTPDDTQQLLSLESLVTEIRENSISFRNLLEEEKKKVYNLSNADNIVNSLDDHIGIKYLACEYNKQIQLEISVINAVLSSFSTLYDDLLECDNSSSFENGFMIRNPKQNRLDLITSWINILEKSPMLDPLIWGSTSFLKNDILPKSSPRLLNDNTTATSPTRPLNKNNGNLHDRVIFAKSLQEATNIFISEKDIDSNEFFTATTILIKGEKSSGKTHVCDEIFSSSKKIPVIYPKLPLDILGKTVGESEKLLSLCFTKARSLASSSEEKKCILLFDNLHYLFGSPFSATLINETFTEPHWVKRMRVTFLTCFDSLARDGCHKNSQGHVLIVSTANFMEADLSSRFDMIFHISTPDFNQRSMMIKSILDLKNMSQEKSSYELEASIAELVKLTTGYLASEISYCCRQAVLASNNSSSSQESSNNINQNRIHQLKYFIESTPSESLRSHAFDRFASIKVFNANDFKDPKKPSNDNALPLLGTNAMEAWKKLKSCIVTPLCFSKELDELLYGNSKRPVQSKSMCAGALLYGAPGCGKTSLALHCASFACFSNPKIKLLNVSCTSLIHKEVGGSEKALSKVFEIARSSAPCILLLDGIESIAQVRGNDHTTQGTMDRLLSLLLTEMDGVARNKKQKGSIAVIGITQEKDWIDPALCRPGRLGNVIQLDYPDYETRVTIATALLEKLPLSFSENTDNDDHSLENLKDLAEFIAKYSENKSVSHIKAICNDAVSLYAREMVHEFKNKVKTECNPNGLLTPSYFRLALQR